MPLRFYSLYRHRDRFIPKKSQDLDFDAVKAESSLVLQKLKTSINGLSESEAKRRLFLYGPNILASRKKRLLIHEFLLLFANPLIVLLLIIATFSIFFGEKFSAIIVYVMALMSAGLSFFQEHRAERAVEKLNALVRVAAEVVRNGKTGEVAIKELVPGDILALNAGDIIPADSRVIEAKDLFVSQSSLTGESVPAEKFALGQGEGFSASDLLFAGSSVASGVGKAVVLKTGQATEFGKLSQSLSEAQEPTAFDKGIRDFTWMMIRAILGMVVVILLINFFGKHDFFESLLFALAVAVGLAPEALPMMVTINLSKGAMQMSKKKVVVKRLDAIQNFGAMDILCTDKTGTLTLDKVVLERYVDVYGKEDETVFDLGFLNSFYQTGLKNLLDQAVLMHHKPHLQNFEKLDEIPFDFTRRLMSVAVRFSGKTEMIAKGAPEEIFQRCTKFEAAGEKGDFEGDRRTAVQALYSHLSEQGFRVLAVAYKELPQTKQKIDYSDEQEFTFRGFMAFLDPPKPTAKEAIAGLESSGIRIKILTGDNELVTEKICAEIGIDVEGLVTGERLEEAPEKEAAAMCEKASVFARLKPLQKERIIRILKRSGHVVGFLGDGINDAPALKAADVGISVNNASEVARESASIILLQKSLLVLHEGVKEGRRVFGNIIKYLRMGSSSNFGNMLSMTGASLILPFLPMRPTQILLNNFLYDLSNLGIPADRVDAEYLQKPKAWDIKLTKKYMVTVGSVSSLFDYLTYAVMWWVFQGYLNPALFQTGWFIESLFSQTLVIYVIRTRKIPFLQSRPGKFLVFTTLMVLCVGFYMPFGHLAKFFGFVRPSILYFAVLPAMLLAYLAMVQWVKNWFIRRYEHD